MRAKDRRKFQGARLTAARLAAGFKSSRQAAIENGWGESTYRSHENGTRGIGDDDAERYVRVYRAKGVDVTAAKIMFGDGRVDESLDEAEGVAPKIVGDAREVGSRFVRAIYGGVVEAGSFRSVDEFDDLAHIRDPIFEAVDTEFPDATIVDFDVSGDSMNALKPHPLLDGFRVVCLDFESLKNRAPVRDGMVVVVEQTINGGQLRERSVKQMEIYRDRTEYCPRSTNPRHKPIVVLRDQDADDGREVTILAIVRRFSVDVKM